MKTHKNSTLHFFPSSFGGVLIHLSRTLQEHLGKCLTFLKLEHILRMKYAHKYSPSWRKKQFAEIMFIIIH